MSAQLTYCHQNPTIDPNSRCALAPSHSKDVCKEGWPATGVIYCEHKGKHLSCLVADERFIFGWISTLERDKQKYHYNDLL